MIKLPIPEFYVFYNGTEDFPLEKELKLSDAFFNKEKIENKKLSEDLDYRQITGLRNEAKQKLNAIKPASVGQASRISGVSPADISVLLVYLEQQRRQEEV